MKAVRVDGKETIDLQPGEWKRTEIGIVFKSPNGHLGATNERWGHEWHEDGTVTVTPSLRISGGPRNDNNRTLWHGYLTAGKWSTCEDSPQ